MSMKLYGKRQEYDDDEDYDDDEEYDDDEDYDSTTDSYTSTDTGTYITMTDEDGDTYTTLSPTATSTSWDDDNDYDDSTTTTTSTDYYTTTTTSYTDYYTTSTDTVPSTTTEWTSSSITSDIFSTTLWTPAPTPPYNPTTIISSSSSYAVSPTPTAEPVNSGGGLSDKNKAIVGGVVGGIGGAAILGAIAFLAITRWKRNRRENDMEVFRPRSDYSASIRSTREMSAHYNDYDYQHSLNQQQPPPPPHVDNHRY